MSRRGRNGVCTYCGVALTKGTRSDDHVVPKCLFSPNQRGGLVKVPACQRCNNHDKSVDDVYFRDWIVTDIETNVDRVPPSVYQAFLRAAGSNPDGKVRSKVARAALAGGRWEPRTTPSGLFAGYAVSYPFGYHPTKPWRRGDGDRNGSHAAGYR